MTYRRGSYGWQNRGRSSAAYSAAALRPVIDPAILDGLHKPALREFLCPLASKTDNFRDVEPRDLIPVASYNWTNDTEPTILVPGCPPIWQNPATPFRVERDSGVSFIDQNRHRVPQYPLLPLVLAVDHLSPEFGFSSVDIVTDRNNLRKLLRWIEGTSPKDFRIDVQLSGSTVLFIRYESLKVETESGRLGFGRNFEQFTTKRLAGCENSTGHHRIVSYEFGGLKLLVRFEVDACIRFDEATQRREDRREYRRTIPGDDPDDLLAALQNMSIRSDDKIKIVSRGVLVPQNSIAELSTIGERKREQLDWQEYLPQLFMSQTPHHFLGLHHAGQCRHIGKRLLGNGELLDEQRKQQPSFDKLCAFLKELREMIIAHGEDARLTLVYRTELRKLHVFRRESAVNALPDAWMNRFRSPSREAIGENETALESRSSESDNVDVSEVNGYGSLSGEQVGQSAEGSG